MLPIFAHGNRVETAFTSNSNRLQKLTLSNIAKGSALYWCASGQLPECSLASGHAPKLMECCQWPCTESQRLSLNTVLAADRVVQRVLALCSHLRAAMGAGAALCVFPLSGMQC